MIPYSNDILMVIGHVNYDYILDIDKFGNLNSSTSIKDIHRYEGGTAGNVAYTAAMMGIKTELFTCGTQAFTESDYAQKLSDVGIMMRTINREVDEVPVPTCFIINDSKGRQKAYIHDDTLDVYNQIQKLNCHRLASYIHITTVPPEFALLCAHEIKYETPNKIISFCPGQNLRLYSSEQIAEMLSYVDILFVNETEFDLLGSLLDEFGDEFPKTDIWPDVLITTLGKEGCTIASGSLQVIESVHVDNAIDPTGAGDAFAGAFLSEYIKGSSLSTAARFASAVASFVVEKRGCQTNIPSYQEACKRMDDFYA